MLVKFVKKANNERIGCVVALARDKIGWSKLHRNDVWNKAIGVDIAKVRAAGCIAQVPRIIRKDFLEMTERAQKYYKKNACK